MNGRTKVLWAVGAIFVLPLFALGGVVAFHLNASSNVARNFLSHDLNKEIVALNSNWQANIQDIDITSKFPNKIDKTRFIDFLQVRGFSCADEGICEALAGYDFICDRKVVVLGTFGRENVLDSVKARYHLVCL